MVKYLVAPSRMPDQLTWFKWEAYTTWISGMALLVLVYYMGAELYLIDLDVLSVSPMVASSISLGGLAIGWIVYDVLCRSPLGRDDRVLAAAGLVFLVALAWGFTQLFSARGAYTQMGALIGTMMVANVFFVIIPNQKKVVAELIAGGTPEPKLGRQAKQRSLHNNYLTLPVVFVMISNHYPLAFASRWNWVILSIVLVLGAVIRHFFNARHRGEASPWWTWAVAVAGMAAIVWLSAQPPANGSARLESSPDPTQFAAVQEVIEFRCNMCHAAEPLWYPMTVPPKGVILETPEQILLYARQIDMQVVRTHAMPPGNITGISDEERQMLAAWIADGAAGPK